MRRLAAPFELLRVRQWIKNLFVAAPLLFALELTNPESLLEAVAAFFAFCLGASAVYTINDIADRKKDAAHPRKKNRPLARGALSPAAAAVEALILLAGAAVVALQVNTDFVLVLAIYVAINLAYTALLKRVVLVDVLVIAVGFVLRVEGGSAAIGVESSRWIILSTLFLALFLGLGKRRGEIAGLGNAELQRPGLRLYSKGALDALLVATVALTVIAYALYTAAPETVARLGTNYLVYTVPLVVYGLFRYYLLIVSNGSFADPTDLVTKDVGVIVCVLLWAVSVVLLIYIPRLGQG